MSKILHVTYESSSHEPERELTLQTVVVLRRRNDLIGVVERVLTIVNYHAYASSLQTRVARPNIAAWEGAKLVAMIIENKPTRSASWQRLQ